MLSVQIWTEAIISVTVVVIFANYSFPQPTVSQYNYWNVS